MHLSDPIDQDDGSEGFYQPRKILVNDTHTQLASVHGPGWVSRTAHAAVVRAKELTQRTPVKVSLSVVLMGVAGLWWWEHCRIDKVEGVGADLSTKVEVIRSEQQGTTKSVDERFNAVDARFDGVDARFDRVERRLDKVERKIDDLGTSLNQKIDQNTRDMNQRLAEIMALLVQKHSRLEKLEQEKANGTLVPVVDGLGRVGVQGGP